MVTTFERAPLAAAALLIVSASTQAAPFLVSDADFVSGVYELRYYTFTNTLVKNGVATAMDSTPLNDLFLTNAGNTQYPAWEYYGSDAGVRYLQAPGASGGYGDTWNTWAAATMGWDFSAVTGSVAKVEVMPWQVLFQFYYQNVNAYGDTIYGDIATPSSFGAGSYVNLYSYTGDNVPDGAGPDAYSAGLLEVTSSLSSGWLTEPELLELKFGYELVDTDIPGRHLQLFRDSSGAYPDNYGFMVRVTLNEPEPTIPEPTTSSLLALGALGALGRFRRRR